MIYRHILIAKILFAIIISSNGYSQINTTFNDTISSSGLSQIFYDIILESDSSYFIKGRKSSNTSTIIFYLKTDKSGYTIKKVHDYNLSNFPYNNLFIIANNKIVSTNWRIDSLTYGIIKVLDFNLDSLWEKPYSPILFSPQGKHVYFNDIKESPDGGFIISGTYSTNLSAIYVDPFLMKLDSLGNINWIKTYNSDHFNSYFFNLEITPDVGIILTTTKDTGSIIKTNALGEIQWQTKLRRDSLFFQHSNIVYSGNNTYIYAVPYSYEYNNPTYNYGIYICKINSITGQIIWDKSYKPYKSTYGGYSGFNILFLPNSNFVITATATHTIKSLSTVDFKNKATLFYFNSYGDSIDSRVLNYHGLPSTQENSVSNILLSKDGSFAGVGRIYNNTDNYTWFFKTDANGILEVNDNSLISKNIWINAFPNPSSGIIEFTLKHTTDKISKIYIYNISGQLVKQTHNINANSHSINLNSNSSGIYFYETFSNHNSRYVGKFILE